MLLLSSTSIATALNSLKIVHMAGLWIFHARFTRHMSRRNSFISSLSFWALIISVNLWRLLIRNCTICYHLTKVIDLFRRGERWHLRPYTESVFFLVDIYGFPSLVKFNLLMKNIGFIFGEVLDWDKLLVNFHTVESPSVGVVSLQWDTLTVRTWRIQMRG